MTKIVVVIVDGLPVSLAQQTLPHLPFISGRLPHRSTAVSCFPSTTGPAYFPFLSGCTPGRADVPGIRWFDRTAPTHSRFPHRGLRSYVGPDARRLATDTRAKTIFARHAWPASSPVPKDLPKRGEAGRDAIWALAHFTHRWDQADARTARKLGRGLRKGREIVFAVFPSVDEFGHVHGIASRRPEEALVAIDRMLEERLDGFDGHLLLSADHGLTDTHTHLDLRGLVEGLAGPTLAFPLVLKPNPAAVVCESGNAMANVYLRGESGWSERPALDRCRELAGQLVLREGIGSVAIRGAEPGTAELWTKNGIGETGVDSEGLFQRGGAFSTAFAAATPDEALTRSLGERYPDAAFALSSLFASDRAGDLLVSAEVGYDLRSRREWPEHHASHGSLDRAHTIVPVLSSRPLPSTPLRTLDLFGLTLELAGIPLAEYGRSDTALLAQGSWQPGVWQWGFSQRWFPWIASVATAVGVVLAVRSQWDAIVGLDWGRSWDVLALGALAFAVPPLVQAISFWVSLRLLGVRAPLAETTQIWGRAFVVRYAPTGALSVVNRVRERDRLGATSQQVLLATAYEHLGSLAAGWLGTGLGVYVLLDGLAPGGPPKLAWLTGTYAVGYLVGFVIPFLPGGLGAREGALVAVYAARYGVGVATALVLSIRLVTTLGEVLAVGLIELAYLVVRLNSGIARPIPVSGARVRPAE